MDFYISEDSSDLENLLLLSIELILILQFCFLNDLFKLCFLTRCLSILTTTDEKKEEQKSTLQIFLKDVTEEKNLEIHKHSWLSIIWIFKKLNSIKSNCLTNYLQSKTTFWAKLSYSITWTLTALNKFILLLCLSLYLSYRESTVVAAPISFH